MCNIFRNTLLNGENAQKYLAGRHFVESPAAEYRDGYLKNSLYCNQF